jgi:hypothetical protein
VDEVHRAPADGEAQVERQIAHVVLAGLVGVGDRPVDRSLAELAVVRRDVRAAAVLQIPRDRVVVVAVDGRDRALGHQRAHLIGMRPVAHEVPAAVHGVDPQFVDSPQRGLERGKVGVDVGDHRDAWHPDAQAIH